MNEPKMWRLGGLIFLVAAVLMFVGENVAIGAAFVAIGALFLAMPEYTKSRGRKKP
jgi:hypothetical protein